MNRKMVFRTVGQIMWIEALLMLFPAVVSLCYGEKCVWAFLIAVGISLVLGLALTLLCKPENNVIYAKEGFIIVALAWIMMSLVGALPFYISGEIPSYVDALFETVSGFTTTGASILEDVEALSRGLLFWRSFTHWIGGMGVIVFVMAIIPNLSDRPIHIMRAEMPGPIIGKIVPKAKDTAKILYLIYIVMTAAEVVLLLFGGLNIYESLVYSFGTAGTGGFGIKADGLSSYSPYVQWVIAVFMTLFGANFNLYYLILIRKAKNAFKSTELWTYLGIIVFSVTMITINIMPLVGAFSDAIRTSLFQVSSLITTTGYATADFNLWPELSKGILLTLMFIGGCAGSTAGGLKISRVILLFKILRKEVRHMLHPRSVNSVRFEGKSIDKATEYSVNVYFIIYVICFFSIFLLLCIEPYDMETHFTAAASCFNNIGPGFSLVGPMGNFGFYTPFSKIILSVAMLLGRLEIFPLIIFVSPSAWSSKK